MGSAPASQKRCNDSHLAVHVSSPVRAHLTHPAAPQSPGQGRADPPLLFCHRAGTSWFQSGRREYPILNPGRSQSREQGRVAMSTQPLPGSQPQGGSRAWRGEGEPDTSSPALGPTLSRWWSRPSGVTWASRSTRISHPSWWFLSFVLGLPRLRLHNRRFRD